MGGSFLAARARRQKINRASVYIFSFVFFSFGSSGVPHSTPQFAALETYPPL
jgi:hypothetical protein